MTDHSCEIESPIFLEIEIEEQMMFIIEDCLLGLVLDVFRACKLMNVGKQLFPTIQYIHLKSLEFLEVILDKGGLSYFLCSDQKHNVFAVDSSSTFCGVEEC
jgi:predicted ribosome-associated RNA-binding protein Tma20